MNSSALFEDWLIERENDCFDPLSREAALPYSFIWKNGSTGWAAPVLRVRSWAIRPTT